MQQKQQSFQSWCLLLCFPVAVKEPVAGPSACQQLRQLLKEALQILQDEGIVYRKVKSQDEVYHVRNDSRSHISRLPL